MNARGSTEVIVSTIGLSMGALNQNLFTMIVAMAVITTTAMPPTLRWALSRIPMRKEEKNRLEREELEDRGFVPNLERLLIAIDDSPNGKFASRVAGTIAGTQGMPTTVLHVADSEKTKPAGGAAERSKTDQKAMAAKVGEVGSKKYSRRPAPKDGPASKEKAKAEDAGEQIKEAAEQVKAKQKAEEKSDADVEVTTVVHETPDADAVAQEAKKGYDLLFIGLEKTVARGGEFHDSVAKLALGFDGPLAIAAVRGSLANNPDGKLSVLVPVNGTEAARRGAEIAITLARANKASLTILYVAQRPARRGRLTPAIHSRRHEEAILKDIVQIADGYNMSVRTAVLADNAAAAAILKEAERRRHNLVVVGVGRRPGERLFFGDTAAALLEKAHTSLLFVAT
jgi:nucleotide-binding universal stress UspA family protein